MLVALSSKLNVSYGLYNYRNKQIHGMECKRIFIRRLHLTNMRYNLTNYEKPGLDSCYSSILHLFIYVQMYFCCTRACMCVPISACECVCVVRTSAYVRACMCVCVCAHACDC